MQSNFFKKQFEDFGEFQKQKDNIYKSSEGLVKLIQISYNGTTAIEIIFRPKINPEYSFILANGIYIKKKFLAKLKMDIESSDKNLDEIILYQEFLAKSPAFIFDNNFLFDLNTRILLCQSLIELLEENNLHLNQYRDTYISLLKLNFDLAESNYNKENETSVNNLYYALKRWLNVCKDFQYTVFEDEKIDREEQIREAIFDKENGKLKRFFTKNKAGKDNDDRFRRVLNFIGIEWFLKQRYDWWHARKIIVKTGISNAINLFLPRMASGIVVGYLPLILTEDVWKFALRNQPFSIGKVLIVAFTIVISFGYLFLEIHKSIDSRLTLIRSSIIFGLGALQSFIIGIILIGMFGNGMAAGPIKDLGLCEGKIPKFHLCGGDIYLSPLFLFASLALFIGIFIQIIWEDKPITHPL